MTVQPRKYYQLQKPELLVEPKKDDNDCCNNIIISSLLGDDGIYHLKTQEQHQAILREFGNNKDGDGGGGGVLVITKFYAPWCRSCKAVAPKYVKIAKDMTSSNQCTTTSNNNNNRKIISMAFCELNISNNKQYVQDLGILKSNLSKYISILQYI